MLTWGLSKCQSSSKCHSTKISLSNTLTVRCRNTRLLTRPRLAYDNKKCLYTRYYNAGCSYLPWCTSSALSSAQDSSVRNSLVMQVGPLFSRGYQNFQEKRVRPDQHFGNFGPPDQFFRRTKISVKCLFYTWKCREVGLPMGCTYKPFQ